MGGCESCGQNRHLVARCEHHRRLCAVTSSTTEEDISWEQDRLEELTCSFIRKVQQGCPGIYVDYLWKQRRAARYCVDKALKNFLVLDAKRGGAILKLPIAKISELHAYYGGEPSDLFPSSLLRTLTAEERQRLILGFYIGESGHEERFYLSIHQDNVAESVQSTEFVEAMQVLKIYAERGGEISVELMETEFGSKGASDHDDGQLELAIQKQRIMRFCRTAVKGSPCSYLDKQACERQKSVYYLDRGMLNFTVHIAQDDETKTVMQVPLSRIVAWYTFDEDGRRDANLFPESLTKLLSPEEKQSTVLALYDDADTGKKRRLFLVVDEVEEFIIVMRILNAYSRKRRQVLLV